MSANAKPAPPCEHKSVSRGRIYDSCEDCGAVRKAPKPGDRNPDEWHSCDLCRGVPALVDALDEIESMGTIESVAQRDIARAALHKADAL